MKNLPKIALSLIVAGVFAHANASTITVSTGYSGAGAQSSAADYQSVVNAAVATPGAGYGSTTIASYDNVSNSGLFGSGSNIAFKSVINFGVSAADAGAWSFRSGVDFGKGGALFLDGVALDFKSNDMWWAGNYNNGSQFFSGSSALSAGNHTLSIYGLEGCCDGGQQAQFKAGNNNFASFGANDGLISAVPEPSTYAMLLIGLGLLGFTARRKQEAKF
ncbi:CCXG family PEP-CTERM protein [Janthinobacterium sp. NKUCC08_JDC]|uniref:CCXG family PEP-CTERM protein n=1 Tax=Janthinobacterium sp. NKUCC08_JDC TaxID=2842122 RepID=UPI001C5B1853|nr:CCXG family PEP-CTERM protein [Janthinobacterium sp. NKUCC08_JDC]MBW3497386.1 CCXG family PEP-CTERM protein [Janthinobacterium sp. NKUCC08_JDC]